MAFPLSERIVEALSEAGYISDDLVTSPDRFDDITAIVDRVLETRVIDILERDSAARG